MSAETDLAAPETNAPDDDRLDADDAVEAPKAAPRRAGGGTRLPVILPKVKPVSRVEGDRVVSTARPQGSAVPAPDDLVIPGEEELSVKPTFKKIPKPSADSPAPVKEPKPAKGKTSSKGGKEAKGKSPKAEEPAVDEAAAPARPRKAFLGKVRDVGKASSAAEATTPKAKAPGEGKAERKDVHPPSFTPSRGITKPAVLVGEPVPTRKPEADSPGFVEMVVEGASANDPEVPKFVGASESGTSVVQGRRRAGGRPLPPREEEMIPVPVPIGTGVGQATIQAPTRPTSPEAEEGKKKKKPAGEVRKVKLQVATVSPWSIAKIGFLMSVGLGVAFVVMVFIGWKVLDSAHFFTSINDQIATLAGPESASKFDILPLVAQGKVMAGATVLAVVNVVLMTALSVIGALIYNVISMLVGGVHVTMRDD
ncbi:MAG: DUF3566 domain-containing protein [Micrococcales bacterium]|nr:DUF3566 domain-containing protein [Micrococcales bacterium]